MKKIITFSTICIIASIFFSSCSSNLSVAKRHFNNGYYVAYSTSKQVVHTPKEEEKLLQNKTRKPLYSLQNKTEQNAIEEYSDQSTTGSSDVVASNENTQHKAIPQRSTKQALKQKIKIIENTSPKIKHVFFKTQEIHSVSSDNEGLSLFWLVILVILILWALGLLAGGFGLGGLINLLLLIALILLILWLLRIV